MSNDDALERARDKQLNKYLDGLEDQEDMELSNCCGAQICQDSDICCECKEHCVTKADEAELSHDNWADSAYEEMRDQRMEEDEREQDRLNR